MQKLIPFIANDWIKPLAKKLQRIWGRRDAELNAICDTFGDPRPLASCYIEPRVQHHNPADYDEDEETVPYVRAPAFETINHFLNKDTPLRGGRTQLFILSDAGMGKTSLLLMLKLAHLFSFWPQRYGCTLLKLGPDSLEQLQVHPNKGDTVLLLDALDEDPQAWGRIQERLIELLQAGEYFRRVIISCRTQFFPEGSADPFGRPGRVEIGGFTCPMLYLSLFDDEQVEQYLAKRFPDRSSDRLSFRPNPIRKRAAELVRPMRSLRFRPLLLAHVGDIVGEGQDLLAGATGTGSGDSESDWNIYRIYDALVWAWLLREERKLARQLRTEAPPTMESLRELCTLVAVHLQVSGKRTLPRAEFAAMTERHPALDHLERFDVGGRSLLNRNSEGAYRFSHYSIQEFLVVRALAEETLDLAQGELNLGPAAPERSAQGLQVLQPPQRLRLTDLMIEFLGCTDLVLDAVLFDLLGVRPDALVDLALRGQIVDGLPEEHHPIWNTDQSLTSKAFQDPQAGTAIGSFLVKYVSSERFQVAAVLHAAHAGRWRLGPLEPERLTPPSVPADQPDYAPSAGWLRGLAGLQQDLIATRGQNQISFKRAAYDDFSRKLDAFRDLTFLESSRWNRWYLEALDAWRSEAAKVLHQVEDQAASQESIAVNRYRTGTPLRPGDDQAVFFGREDLRQNLAREIMTAAEMPLFLILGQRRVGKTSLLNFLPEPLGSGFVVVSQDLQDDRVESVPAWLADLRRLVAEKLGRDDGDWTPPDGWLAAWRGLREWLEGIETDGGHKLILALDEFEELHGYLAQEPEQGRRLLAAIRSFSQHQNRVVLLFVGATPLSELRDPDWSRYFVQTQLFRVDYLARADALRLITEPVPLQYPAAVTERLFALTQGHPELLQRLCRQLVSIANREGRQAMSMADLEEAVAVVLEEVRGTGPIERFWNEFCRAPACRACIEQILAGEIPADRPSLMRLEEHGYLVLDQGRPRLRVPLFEDWLRKYREGFPTTEC